MRIDPQRLAVTVSGRDKGRLDEHDVMQVDLAGKALDHSLRPSAETLLHAQLYRCLPRVGAVLHTHSHNQTVASRLYAGAGRIMFEGYELQKAISGNTTHEGSLEVPVFPNTQYMDVLVRAVDAWLAQGRPLHAYLIDGHGIYAWGEDMAAARRHLDAFEFLLGCELDLRRMRA
jgi:methylthioribulose-1-phosphate dehydratase